MVISVDLCNADLVRSVLEDVGKLIVDGGEVLAVTAPGGEELYKRRLAGLENDIVEGLRFKVEYGGGGCKGGEQRNRCGEYAVEQHGGDILTLKTRQRVLSTGNV